MTTTLVLTTVVTHKVLKLALVNTLLLNVMIIMPVLMTVVALFLDVSTPIIQTNVSHKTNVLQLAVMNNKDAFTLIFQIRAMMLINVTHGLAILMLDVLILL
jgi:hypothetical protein